MTSGTASAPHGDHGLAAPLNQGSHAPGSGSIRGPLGGPPIAPEARQAPATHRPVPQSVGPDVRVRLTEATPTGIAVGLDTMGTPLTEVDWVVVDLETTGIGAQAAITEIGAVRVRGRDIVDEFQTLVDPEQPIPPAITALTGITSSMLEGAPTIDVAYPAFARWAGLEDEGGTPADSAFARLVLVAHNANFDMGFLRRTAHQIGHEWPRPTVVDTLALARVALPRPMVANHRLATLAAHVHTSPQSRHRALGDARTTVEVLLALCDLLSPVGVTTIEDLGTVGAPVPHRRRRRVEMADDLPRTPGVYRFVDSAGAPLYIGSATNVRSRVRSYFTASEQRNRVRRMLDIAADVRVTPTSTILEARVEELRAIRHLHPLFNSASTHQEETRWVVRRGGLVECVPVLSQAESAEALGPFRGFSHATRAIDALTLTYPVDGAGPLTGAGRVDDRRRMDVDAALRGEHCEVVDALLDAMARASEQETFEHAAAPRDQLAADSAGLQRRSAVLAVASARRIVWAHHQDDGGWVVHGASWGRLTDTMITPPRTSPVPWVEAILQVPALPDPDVHLARTTWEEARLVSASITGQGARLIHWDGDVDLAESWDSPLARTGLLDTLGLARH